jgi:hypothetical protein
MLNKDEQSKLIEKFNDWYDTGLIYWNRIKAHNPEIEAMSGNDWMGLVGVRNRLCELRERITEGNYNCKLYEQLGDRINKLCNVRYEG